MKISTLIATAAVGLLSSAALHAQNASFNAPASRARTRNAPVRLHSRTDGAVVRAARSGQPLQMVNPGAPAEYGDGRDMVRREADDPYQRPQGLKLFVIEF